MPQETKKILIVDDEPGVVAYLEMLLQDHGYETASAANGEEALVKARSDRPDLITLDISMPGKDGVEVFRELRGSPDTAGMAICVVTGHPEFREVIYSASVSKPDGYMHKPVNPDDLVGGLRRILDLKKAEH